MKIRRLILPVVVLIVFLGNAYAQEWPQFLGPTRNSISPQKDIMRTWPADGPEVLWTTNLGIGYGGPVAKDGKAYLLDRDDQAGDMLKCFDLSNGKELWNFSYKAPGSVMFPGSRSVPALDGNYVYSCGPYGDLYCIDINTHKPVWNKNVWTEFGGAEIPKWAIAQCPLVFGNLLIIASQAPQAGVVAYEKLTGEVKWTSAALGPEGYVSPALVKVGGEDHVVMITASAGGGFGRTGSGGKVVGIDPNTGKILWEYTNWQCRIPAPVALDAGESRILVTGGYEAGAAMIKIEKKADGTYDVKELYKNADFGAHTQPPVLYNGFFYAQYTTNERKDGLVCMSMDGEIKWKTGKSPAFDKGGMIIADGLLFSTDGGSRLYLIEPDPSAFKPVASAELLKTGGVSGDPMATRVGGDTQNWAPLALAEGKLLIRDQSRLVCVKVAK
jgi:outer membrane protein assembly factor BamB